MSIHLLPRVPLDARMLAMLLPAGWLTVAEATKLIVRLQGAEDRDKSEEAWRNLCEHASEERIRAIIFDEDGKVAVADPMQFISLQSRYLFNAGTQEYWLENEQRHVEIEVNPNRQFLDKHGRSVRGDLLFSGPDLEAIFGAIPVQAEPYKRPTLNDRKRAAVLGAFETLGRDNLTNLSQKEREGQVIKQVKDICNLEVSDRYIRDRWLGN